MFVILHSVTGKSAKALSESMNKAGLPCKVQRPYKDGYIGEDGVKYINLGCSKFMQSGEYALNTPQSVLNCVDKRTTFKLLSGLPIPRWCDKWEDIGDDWTGVVARAIVGGNNGDGLEYYDTKEQVPKGLELYTETHYWSSEFRVIVSLGRVFVYKKLSDKSGAWVFKKQVNKEYDKIVKTCVEAARRLGVEHVGFDVLAHNRNKFIILEANSGSLLSEEVIKHMVRKFRGLF